MVHLLGTGALCLYLLSAVVCVRMLLRRREEPQVWAPRFLLFGLVLHSFMLLTLIVRGRQVLLEDRGDFFLWISWVMPISYLWIRSRISSVILGACVASATSLFLVSSSVLVHIKAEPRPGGSDLFLLGFHVFPILLAVVCFVLAGIVSSVFLLQEGWLKRKTVDGMVIKGPSLAVLKVFNSRAVLVGFVMMTFALVSGTVWAVSKDRPLLTDDLLQWSAVLAWCLLGWILHCRIALEWSERRVSTMTVWLTSLFIVAIVVAMVFGGNLLHGNYYSG